MGGGDLNLKKSWHPHTMKNQEKVWKAEKAKTHEEKKLNDLRKEIEDEKNREELKRIGEASGVLAKSDGDKKLEWMYKGTTELINREEYLLGRSIDKSFEVLQAEEKNKEQDMVGIKQSINHVEHECIPFSIRSYRNLDCTEQVDLQRKVMEDPLMLIKQREMESRRKLLENPVKLKELHRILKTDQKLKKVKKSKKSKKSKIKKKHKKRDRSSSSSSSESETDSSATGEKELDKMLAKRYKKLKSKEKTIAGLDLTKLLEAKYETISKELDKAVKSEKKSKRNEKNTSSSDDASDSSGQNNLRRNRLERKSRSPCEDRYTNRQPRFNQRNHNASRRDFNSRQDFTERKCDRSQSHYQSKQNSPARKHSSSRQNSSTRRASRRRSPAVNCSRGRDISPSRRASPVKRRSRSRENTPTRKRYHSKERSSNRKRSRSRLRSPIRDYRSKHGTPPRKRSHSRQRSKEDRRSPIKKHSNDGERFADNKRELSNRVKLTDEEKEARRLEMMENAKWREDDRTKIVRKHREEYAKEEQQNKARDFDKEFINKEVKKALANQTSVGSRIHSNLNNIQRTSAAMNSNFARK